jgi:TetR/AcrR family transcriptional regulator, acrAB operon repressor
MPRKPAHAQFDTLKTIQDRAFELFGRHGYEGVSIGDIAAASKLSKGAMYWHFEGKEDLFLVCLHRLHAIFEEHVISPMQAQQDAMLGVITLFQGFERMLRDPRVENGVAGYWLVPSTPETARLTEAQRAFEARAQASVREVLALGASQGSFDLGDALEPMSRAMISLLEAAILALRNQTPDEVHQTTTVLARTLFRAYARPEALQKLARLL